MQTDSTRETASERAADAAAADAAAAEHYLELLITTGEELARSFEPEQAEEIFQKIAAVVPGHGYPHRAVGELDLNRGELDRARASLETAIERSPEDARAHMLLGDLLLQVDDLEGASRALETGLAQTDPSHPLYAKATSQLALSRRLQSIFVARGPAGLEEAKERLARFRAQSADSPPTEAVADGPIPAPETEPPRFDDSPRK
ncbi:MAG: tetratricopeptide repeat protein [Acidobacteriota bacterium]